MKKTLPEAAEENAFLKQAFAAQGLDPEAVWAPTPGFPEIENRQLRYLLNWVGAYRANPSREALREQGYEFPPVEPDIDPDSDWLRFERWMTGQPLTWNYAERFGPLKPARSLTDDDMDAELALIGERLAQRGVYVMLNAGVPPALEYSYLQKVLEEGRFDMTAPGVFTHLNGCGGDCGECFQRPWCATAADALWSEEDDDPAMAAGA